MDYRFVVLNSSGAAQRAEDWSCASDIDAIARAAQEATPFGAELWRGDHCVRVLAGRLEAKPEAKGSSARP
jgi:hypothetical protein